MNRKKIVSMVILGALAMASVFGAVAYRTVLAQTATPTAPTNNSAAAPTGRGEHGGPGGTSNADLATALGITTDQLNTAYQTATAAALKQAVSQGLITQAQADQITANGGAFPFDGRWSGYLSQNGLDFNQFLADALGISVDKLTAAYATAFNARIDAAVTAGTLTQTQADLEKGQYALTNNKAFQTSMQTAYQAAVKQAVSDGVITQAQADAILKANPSFGMGGFRGMGGPGGFGGHGGHGGHGGPDGFGLNAGTNGMNAGSNGHTTTARTATS